mgnify:CR=1 FL=1
MAGKKYPPPESRAVSKHILVYPSWIPTQRYHEYQASRAHAAREEHDKINQETERHNALSKTLKSTEFPFPKRKSNRSISMRSKGSLMIF